MSDECESYFQNSYGKLGFGAQRRYPNEELMRFMGRTFFPVPPEKRKAIRILEVGCGSGANLWMIAREGFDAYGIDLSAKGVDLCRRMMELWDCTATLRVGDMSALPYQSDFFDAVVDVFSSYCLPEKDFVRYLDEVARVLKPGGKYFSYTPSKESGVFKEANAADKIDESTLKGITRPTAPYYGDFHAFRFISRDEHADLLSHAGEGCFKVTYNEIVSRTYGNGQEYFEFVVIQADKQ